MSLITWKCTPVCTLSSPNYYFKKHSAMVWIQYRSKSRDSLCISWISLRSRLCFQIGIFDSHELTFTPSGPFVTTFYKASRIHWSTLNFCTGFFTPVKLSLRIAKLVIVSVRGVQQLPFVILDRVLELSFRCVADTFHGLLTRIYASRRSEGPQLPQSLN